MSAPPIGMMIITPSTSEATTISQNTAWLSVLTSTAISTTSSSARPALITCRPGSMIGLPLIRPSSLRKAITEPVKVIAPIATPRLISTSAWAWIAPTSPMPSAEGA
ncbi:hypothetical protein A6302_04480 [Methylobrevis pamukkalensis]|uniref:Uncharacterized protein n=1 Tax=Methylobrevis pamukkalensis TaxID=1439726 RepID=A0A1E3GPE9_9HYPH|nr:hypothetical protein A6302_04480 [Methylobrevis pamukkalensis]